MKLPSARIIENLISENSGHPAEIQLATTVGGGCINQAQKIVLKDGRQFFLKINSLEYSEMFVREASGLNALRSTDTIRVPKVIGFGQSDVETFLILEHIQTGRKQPGFFESFGRQLAALHLRGESENFGYHDDNFIGSTLQPNGWSPSWIEFWSENRIEYQLRLAREKGLGSKRLQSLGRKLLERLPVLLATNEVVPALLHGDLWSGNYLSDSEGHPVLIDPAVYFGHNEAEFGMTTLFGGFDDAFYAAYNEVSPFEEGWQDRVAIYRLYHLLNHLNLFGTSYLSGCLDILEEYT